MATVVNSTDRRAPSRKKSRHDSQSPSTPKPGGRKPEAAAAARCRLNASPRDRGGLNLGLEGEDDGIVTSTSGPSRSANESLSVIDNGFLAVCADEDRFDLTGLVPQPAGSEYDDFKKT